MLWRAFLCLEENTMGMSANTIQKQRPALRLVSTKGLSREEWLKVRKQGIGSSDAAAAVDSTAKRP